MCWFEIIFICEKLWCKLNGKEHKYGQIKATVLKIWMHEIIYFCLCLIIFSSIVALLRSSVQPKQNTNFDI